MTDQSTTPTPLTPRTEIDTDGDLDFSGIDFSDMPGVVLPSEEPKPQAMQEPTAEPEHITPSTDGTRKRSNNPLRDMMQDVERQTAEEEAAKGGQPERTPEGPSASPAKVDPPHGEATESAPKATGSRPKPKTKGRKKAAVQSTELDEAKTDDTPAVQSTELPTKSLPFGHPDRDDYEGVLVRIAVDDIVANGRFRARGKLDVEDIAKSLELNGQLQPIHVRKVVRDDGTTGYELICGYRRYTGAKSLGWQHINAIIVEATDEQAAAMSLVENHARKETSKTDVARGLLLLRETTGKKLEEVAEAHGLGRTQAFAYTGILKMPKALQEAIGDIEHGCELEHAKVLHKAAKDGEWDDGKLSDWIARVDSEKISVRDLRDKLNGAVIEGRTQKKPRERMRVLRATLGEITRKFGNQKVLGAAVSVMTPKERNAEADRCDQAIEAIRQYRVTLVQDDTAGRSQTELS